MNFDQVMIQFRLGLNQECHDTYHGKPHLMRKQLRVYRCKYQGYHLMHFKSISTTKQKTNKKKVVTFLTMVPPAFSKTWADSFHIWPYPKSTPTHNDFDNCQTCTLQFELCNRVIYKVTWRGTKPWVWSFFEKILY